ncbi:MAG: tetratricopeptide repeat protein, partial [Gemmatimonadales bacterium]
FEIQRASSDYLAIDDAEVETVDGLDTEVEFEAPPEEAVEPLEFEATAVEEPVEPTPAEPEPAPELELIDAGPVEQAAAPAEEVEFEGVAELEELEPAEGEEDIELMREVELDVVDARPSYNELVVDTEEAEELDLTAAEGEADVEKDEEIELAAAETDVVDKPHDVELAPTEATDLGVEVEHEEVEAVWDDSEVGALEVPELDLTGFDDAGDTADTAAAPTAADTAEPETKEPETREPAEATKDAAGFAAGAAEELEEEFDQALDSVLETPIVGAEDVEAAVAAEAAEPVQEIAAPDLAQLELMVADDPDDPDLHRALAEALVESGDRQRGLEEFDIVLQLYEHAEDWKHADRVVSEILRVDPNSVRHHQKRVELAFQQGDKSGLAAAYLGLADALLRNDDVDRARAVYHRVLEHDPANEEAATALSTLEPVEEEVAEPAGVGAQPEPPAESDFVDLGALILEDDEPVKDTRMRIEEEEPTGDEQKDFEEMLSEFKRGIEANLEDEDWQAHYDLGVAFKEMGLLDEAIGEFQKALRSAEGRLKTAEALGLCFFEKGQHSVAGTVLRRAVDADPSGDDAKIGLLYWLARCEEEQGKRDDAMAHYQRVFAIDINFEDVEQRVRAIGG